MHYKDGTEAKLRDIVKGTGYNVKDASGNPKVLVGEVTALVAGRAACNVTIEYINSGLLPANGDGNRIWLSAIEWGQCDAFELVHRPE